MAKNKKKDEKPAEKPSAEKKSGGLLGRLFGGGGGKGDKAATPKGDDAMDAPTIPPGHDEMDPELAKTIPPVDRDDPFSDPADALTMAPFDRPAGLGGGKPGKGVPASPGPADPFDDPGEARTIPPFDPPKSVKGGGPKPPTVELDPFDDGEARTLAPFDPPKSVAPAQKKVNVPPPSDVFSADAMTLPPTPKSQLRDQGPLDDDIQLDDDLPLDAPTIAPGHLKGLVPPRSPGRPPTGKPGRPREDDNLTQDPLLTPTPKDRSKDPFAFEDDLLGAAPADKSATPPPRPRPAPPQDDLGFGDDVADLLAPMPGAPLSGKAPPPPAGQKGRSAPPNDPFGPALADDPFELQEGGVARGAAPNKTDEIPSFDVELGAHPAAASTGDDASSERDEKTMEMDRPPPGLAATRRDPPRAAAPPPAPRRTLFASQVAQPDGARRFGPPAPEVQVDLQKGTLHAPRIDGGWHEVPAFAVVLSDGSVVGRLPRGVKTEADGSFMLPPAPLRRAASNESGGPGKRVPAFPEGVLVDRKAGFAFVPADRADSLAGSPEPVMRLEDGSLVVSIPSGATWNDDGSYTVPPSAPRPLDPDTVVEKAKEAHSAHGSAIFKSVYLGCEEIVYEDGWAALKLPKSAKVEGELVLLPAASRREPGAPPALLEVDARPDGLLGLRLPPGYVPDGDVAWLPPAEIAPEEPLDAVETDWGEPTEELDYCGVHEALYANGWTRIDLPPGARVTGRRLSLPAEYAHAGDAKSASQFDRDTDGSLVFDLPKDAEALGTVVLIPPEGVRSLAATFTAPPPPKPAPADGLIRRSTQSFSSSPSPSSSPASESALPPGGAGVGPKTKGIDRFRMKKGLEEEEKKAGEPKADEKKPDEPKADEKKADEPKADEKKADEPKADEKKPDEPKADEKKAEDKKPDEPKADEKKAEDKKSEDKKPDEPKAEDMKPEADDEKDDGAEDAPGASPVSGRKRKKKG